MQIELDWFLLSVPGLRAAASTAPWAELLPGLGHVRPPPLQASCTVFLFLYFLISFFTKIYFRSRNL